MRIVTVLAIVSGVTALPGAVMAESGVVRVGKFDVPLPAGNFELVASATTASGGNARAPIARAVYGQTRDGRFSALVVVATNTEALGGTWNRDPEICDRRNTYFNFSDKAYDPKNIDCWLVGHRTLPVTQDTAPHMAQANGWARANGAGPIAVGTAYFIARGPFFLSVLYFFNPDLAGIAPTVEMDWSKSPWHVDRYRDDPAKAAFYAKIKVFGDSMLPNLQAALAGQSRFPAPPDVFEAKAADNGTTAEARLRQLRDLADRGQISPAEFEIRKKQILDSL